MRQLSNGKWVPYSQSTTSMIKRLHTLALRDRQATSKFERWLSKFPANRVGPRPVCMGTERAEYQYVQNLYLESQRTFDLVNDTHGFLCTLNADNEAAARQWLQQYENFYFGKL